MSRVAARVAAALALVLVLPACSTVPSSSPTVQITQAPARPVDEIGIEPASPEPGETPEDIVRGFIDAAASTRQGHRVAREHLAPEPAISWSDEAGITIISSDYATVTTVAGSVAVSAIVIGRVDERGVFVGGGEETFRREFTLEQIEEEWRITNPLDGLIMAEPDFERLYDERAAYFLDQTGQRVVPDPRHLIRGEAQPTALVQRLLEGPSATLAAGVRNPLAGLQLRSSVTVRGQEATVDLRGLPADPAPQLAQICAQLVWTLAQPELSISSVVVQVDGEEVGLEGVPAAQTVADWASLDPDAVPVDGVGHYLSGGALRTVTAGEPADGPAGAGAYGLTSAAVAADARTGALSFLVGVRQVPGAATLVAGPYGGELAAILDATTFSAPSVAATRKEAWVVRDGTSLVRVLEGAPPQAVNAPTLFGLGRVQALRLSPDGVRAAVVVEGPVGLALYVGTVVRAEDGSVALRDLRDIAPSLSQVADVAWGDSDTLLVLAGDARDDRIAPYSVGVDGWGLVQVPTAGLPTSPSSIAGAPTRQPLVDAGGTIWQLAGGNWVTLVRGREPLPGAAPFYPL